jgi:YidC/Oxa1 family membrane protein insertase
MMDKNQAIGLILISVMIFVWFFFFTTPPTEVPQKIQEKDSTSQKKVEIPKPTENLQAYDSVFLQGKEQELVLENKSLKITFSTKGGKIKQVLLKEYKTYEQKPLFLLDESFSKMSYQIPTEKGKIDLYEIFYTAENKANTLIFRANASGKSIEQIYTLTDSYELDYQIKINGFELKNNAVWTWNAAMPRTEKDATPSRIKSTITYFTKNGGYDYLSETNDKQEKTITDSLRWIAFKQQFFLASVFATQQNAFVKAQISTIADENQKDIVKNYAATLEVSPKTFENQAATFKFYFGPNKYDILKKFDESFSRNVGLGWGIFGWVNKFLIIPIIDLLSGFIDNYGLLIIALGIVIRLILFPLNYKSYIGMAKMKVLKPELDDIKARTGGDMKKMQQEQMELYRQVGINPLLGCIPMLLQMPIVIAVFTYFPNAIELRQESFLWADDLSTYDSIAKLPFSIPFYGDHVSLFTILMTASTIVYTWYSNQTSTIEGPMKTVGYIMPVMFMFMLNSYPAGLSYYYLVTNVLSIFQQIGIKKLVDEQKIREILEKNREKNKDKKKSGFQQRLEEALKAQQERLETKQRDLKNKKKGGKK